MPRVPHTEAEMAIYSFGQKSPRYMQTCQYYIDTSGLRDPGSSGDIRKKYDDGRAIEVQDYMKEDNRVQAVIDNIRILAFMHLKSQGRDGKWLSFAITDHHGKWTAPAIAELAADQLAALSYRVSVVHIDIEGK